MVDSMPKKDFVQRARVNYFIKNRPYAFGELQKATGIDDGQLGRILKEKQQEGIYSKNDSGEWYLLGAKYIEKTNNVEYEQNRRLAHSKNLSPHLCCITDGVFYFGLQDPLYNECKALCDHLKSYPEIWRLLTRQLEQIEKNSEGFSEQKFFRMLKADVLDKEEHSKIIAKTHLLSLRINDGIPLDGDCRICADNIKKDDDKKYFPNDIKCVYLTHGENFVNI